MSSPVFWTREYFLQEDLKQLGGQDIGQAKQHGTVPCTFFSKKMNAGNHHTRDKKLVGEDVFKDFSLAIEWYHQKSLVVM